MDSLLGYRSPMHGPRPQLRAADTHDQELTFLAERIRSWLATDIEPHAIGVAARSARQAREARDALKAAASRPRRSAARAAGKRFGLAPCTA